MGKRRFKIYVMTAALALCLCACGINSKSDMVFSDVRAYRDASQLDHDAEPDIPIITDGYYMMSDNHELIVEAFELLNKARDDNGLEALAWNQELETCACIRAEEIAYSFDKNHLRPMGAQWYTVNPGILLGENICRGPGDAEKVMKSWLENPADRENFLCPDLTEVAIGVYEDSEGHFYWACEFGNDSSQKSSSAVSDEKSASDNTGHIDPQLVEEETDESGKMAMDNTRDHQKFGAADKLYIGHWGWDKETESTLDIIPDSTDLGGYYVEFFLYRIADYRGNAALLDDGNLYFEGSFDGNNLPISGVIRKTDKGVSFTVEKSDFEYVAEGEVYDYIREE